MKQLNERQKMFLEDAKVALKKQEEYKNTVAKLERLKKEKPIFSIATICEKYKYSRVYGYKLIVKYLLKKDGHIK